MNITDIVNKFEGKSTGPGKWQVKCPVHQDKRASVSITEDGDKTLIYCHAGCDNGEILKAVGLDLKDLFNDNGKEYDNKPKRHIEKIYKYTDEEGKVIHEKVKYSNKDFFNRQIKDDKTIWNLKGITPLLYNLPKLVQAIKNKETIFIVEGEKDADKLIGLGFAATTNYEGAGNGKFKKHYVKYFKGANVVVIQDNDKAGKEATETIVNLLFDDAESIKAIDLSDISKVKGFDITDYFDIGYTKEEFIEMIESAPIITKKNSALGKDTKGNTNITIYEDYSTAGEKITDSNHDIWYEVNEKNGNIKLIPGLLADYLSNSIPAIYTTGRFYLYDNGVYNICNDEEEKTVVMNHIYKKCRTMKHIADIAAQWGISENVRVKPEELNKDPYILNLNNGLYYIKERELKDHTPKILSSIRINANYNKESKGPAFEKFINEVVPDKDNLLLVQEMLGYSITSFNNAKKIFILDGKGDTGKSTLLNIIEDLLTEKNVSNVMLQKLSDRFNTAQLFGKTANIFADLPSTPLKGDSIFKALTGDDKVQAERKGQDPFNFYNKAKLIFSCNGLPDNYGDRSDAFYNRLIILPFNNSVPKEKQDPNLRDKLNKELDYILLWAIEGLERLIKNNFIFTENDATKELVEEYKINSNSVLLFINEMCQIGKGNTISSAALYDAYRNYCEDNGMKPLKVIKFNLEVTNNYPGEVIKDDSFRIPGTNKRGFEGIKLRDDTIVELNKWRA